MRVSALAPVLSLCLLSTAALWAQQGAPIPKQPQGTPVTAAEATNTDAAYQGPQLDLSLPEGGWQGADVAPPAPPGMMERATPGDPAMVYFALHHRTGAGISAADAATIESRRGELARAASFSGYDLHQPGWWYQQTVCPATQPSSDVGEGSILLHFVRRDQGRLSTFTALVPRDPAGKVRAIAVAHNSMEQHQYFLNAATSGPVVNQAMPPAVLQQNLDPLGDWIATGACIAEMGGAYPHIPNEPSLSNDILTAPGPYLQLGVDGQRAVFFTDRVDDAHYVVWDEEIARDGRMQSAHREQHSILPPRMLHPREPKTRIMAEGALPKVKIQPYPPSPVDGN